MPTKDEWDTRIPYRLGTDHYCTYEDEGEESYVRMGDMIWYVYDDPYAEVEFKGELCSVRYDESGFIDAVSVYVADKNRAIDYPCDGVFFRVKGGSDDTD
jgi:hypothetical protein